MPTIQFFQPEEGRQFEGPLDLNAHLVAHPTATFFLRAGPDVRRDSGVLADDLLVIDRAVTPGLGSLVIVIQGGELLVERFRRIAEDEAEIWGVVTYLVRKT